MTTAGETPRRDGEHSDRCQGEQALCRNRGSVALCGGQMFPSLLLLNSSRGRRRVNWQGTEASGAGEEEEDVEEKVDTRQQQQQQRRQQYTHTARRQEKKTLGQTNWFCESAGRTGAAQCERREARCALGTVVKEEGGGEAELNKAGAPP
ncbi:hypothetical protein CRENBAI_024282 [Crenichthys baileyi]|uniref:Uncharacterized protein n=1 Tax=Crenichthys baileyi TaxID=28760 RepID=A0AAV9SML3_9TELE